MLRKIMCAAGAAVFVLALVFSGSAILQAADKYIGEAKAKEIALAHAKVKVADAKFTKVKLDKDDYHLLKYYNMMVINRPASLFLEP